MLSPMQPTQIATSELNDFIAAVSPIKGIFTTKWADDPMFFDPFYSNRLKSPIGLNNSFNSLPSSSRALDFGTPTFPQFNGSPRPLFDQAGSPHQDLSNISSISPIPSKINNSPQNIPAFRSVNSFRLRIDPQLPGFQQKASRVNRVLNSTDMSFESRRRLGKRRTKKSSDRRKRKSGARGIPGEKPNTACNCKKSRCLKLYCECFAALLMCKNCNCLNCENNPQFEAVRNQAIAVTRSKNPNAFVPKFKVNDGDHAHLKGCQCKKSNCKKRYCECFASNVPCGAKCKCRKCKNKGPSRKLAESNEAVNNNNKKFKKSQKRKVSRKKTKKPQVKTSPLSLSPMKFVPLGEHPRTVGNEFFEDPFNTSDWSFIESIH